MKSIERKSMQRGIARTAALRMAVLAALAAFGGFLALSVPGVRDAGAYPAWSTNRTTGYCATCHGDFRASGYVSKSDLVPWVGGTSLHNGHRSNMLNSDCNACHTSSRFPVDLGSASGGNGLSPISCLGCHGRAEPAAGGMVTGTGLRQHHTRNASATCSGTGCHSDADPKTFTAAAETVAPPFYFSPDAAHPNKPTSPCNTDNLESLVSTPLGLDNDGDNVYDAQDCVVTDVPLTGVAIRLEGARPNPSPGGHLRVAFTLSTPERAVLEAIDITGRRVGYEEVSQLGVGPHVVDLAPSGGIPPGVYMLRLTQGQNMLRSTAIVVR